MKLLHSLVALTALISIGSTALAADYQHSAPAVQGYDVVSYQLSKRPLRGNGNFVATHDGATYLFATEEDRDTFNKSPDKYTPAYNGYCAFGVGVGKKFIGDPEVWRVVDGKLYLNLDASIQDLWLKDVPGQIKTANTEWKRIADKDPSSL